MFKDSRHDLKTEGFGVHSHGKVIHPVPNRSYHAFGIERKILHPWASSRHLFDGFSNRKSPVQLMPFFPVAKRLAISAGFWSRPLKISEVGHVACAMHSRSWNHAWRSILRRNDETPDYPDHSWHCYPVLNLAMKVVDIQQIRTPHLTQSVIKHPISRFCGARVDCSLNPWIIILRRFLNYFKMA